MDHHAEPVSGIDVLGLLQRRRGNMPVLRAGLLFESSDANLIHEATTGRVVGSFTGCSGSGSLPAGRGNGTRGKRGRERSLTNGDWRHGLRRPLR